MEIYEAHEMTEEIYEAFQRLTPQLSSSSAAPTWDELADLIASQASHLLIAVDEGMIVGSLTLAIFRVPTGIRAWIEDVVVDDSQRGKGIGEALTRAGLNLARELGAKTVDLTSRPSREAANRLYQRVGFELRQTNAYRFKLKDQ